MKIVTRLAIVFLSRMRRTVQRLQMKVVDTALSKKGSQKVLKWLSANKKFAAQWKTLQL